MHQATRRETIGLVSLSTTRKNYQLTRKWIAGLVSPITTAKIVSSFRIAFRGIMREVSSLDLTRPKTLNCKEWANYVDRVVRCFGESLGNLKFGEFTVHYNRLQDKLNRKLFIQVMKDQLYIRLTRFKPNLIPYLSVKRKAHQLRRFD